MIGCIPPPPAATPSRFLSHKVFQQGRVVTPYTRCVGREEQLDGSREILRQQFPAFSSASTPFIIFSPRTPFFFKIQPGYQTVLLTNN
jgi:hypothetical protein